MTGDLARYRYISTIGSGGMARVDLAEDMLLGREVALKRIAGPADHRGLSRLRREALAGASLSHPNLVAVYDVVSSDDGQLVIVMEYVAGGTLRDALSRQSPLPAAQALRALEGVAAGLDAIHERGIVHRDVKPSNILLGEGGAVKIADLGIAALPDRTRITTSGSVLGSLSYMAPEQLENAPSTPAIDIYALAAVAYEILSGEKARRETNPVALAHAIATQPPPDLRNVRPDAPAGAADLLVRAMARDPAERPRSAGELVSRLRAVLAPEPTAPVSRPGHQAGPLVGARNGGGARQPPPERHLASPRQRQRRSRTGPIIAAVLALVAAAAVVAIVLSSGGSGPRSGSGSGQTAQAAAHRHRAVASARSRTSSSTTSAQASTAAAPPAAPRAAGSPVDAVESFYHAAAAHRYAAAWALADPTMRAQLGGYPSFEAGQAGDRSITFNSARVLSRSSQAATVAVQTTSVRDNGTQQCAGSVELVPDGTQWRLHLIHISC